jgi:hypothetical protein
MSTQTDTCRERSKRSENKPENNRKRLERMLRIMMREGLDFTADAAFSEISLPRNPRRVIE